MTSTCQRLAAISWTTLCSALAVVALMLGGSALRAAEGPPTLVVHHGRIVTVDDRFSIAEAMAVRGERITAVGTNAEIQQLAGAATRSVDLQGRTVVPGLMDSHVHAAGAAVYEFDHAIPPLETVADVLDYIGRRAEALEDGQWIIVQQVFVTRLRDQRFPTRRELDAAAPKNPVVFRTGPDAAVNSLALELSGIDQNFQIPAGEAGQIERDPTTGELTGMIRSATRFIKEIPATRQPSFEEQRAELRKLLADYNSVGITSISERGASEDVLKVYESLKASGDLNCRAFICRMIDPNQPWETVQEQVLAAAQHPAHQYDPLVWLRGIKIFLDGGMLTGSAYMREPWGVSPIYSITDPQYRGVLQVEPERLYETARLCLENDLQFMAHAVGDGAVHALIDAYRRIDEHDFPISPRRPCITHCNFMSAEAISEMAQRGIVADLQPIWLFQDGKTLRDHFGEERLTWFQPYKSLFEQGVTVGGGSDHMQKVGSLRSVNPYNPWLGMWITLSRRPRGVSDPLHAEQAITREQALRLYTINNAFLMFDEQNKGSLEAGKLADFVVLDRDYLTCELDAIRDIQVDQTWLGGHKFFQFRANDPLNSETSALPLESKSTDPPTWPSLTVPPDYYADWIYWTCGVVLLFVANGICWLATFFTLPGNWFIVGLAALCAWLFPERLGDELGFSWISVAVLAVLAGIGELVELAAGAAGAAKQGASRRAMALSLLGAAVGSFAGVFVGAPIPVIGSLVAAVGGGALGAFAGAYLGEYWKGRLSHERLSISTGAMLGRIAGTIGKLIIGAIMVAYATVESFLV